MAILAFDVGGSSIKFSVMTADGEIFTRVVWIHRIIWMIFIMN